MIRQYILRLTYIQEEYLRAPLPQGRAARGRVGAVGICPIENGLRHGGPRMLQSGAVRILGRNDQGEPGFCAESGRADRARLMTLSSVEKMNSTL